MYNLCGYYSREKYVVHEVANIELIYWSVRSYRRRGKGGESGKSLLWPAVCFTISERQNLVKGLSNNMSQYLAQIMTKKIVQSFLKIIKIW